jgi:cytochrome c oxidase assembly protein subunit 15
MDLQVAFEWGHRVLAGFVALCFTTLAVLTLRRPVLRAAAGGWIAVAAVLLGAQVLLGALTVWLLLAVETVTAHLVVGNAFNACLLVLALRLRAVARPRPRPAVPRAARVALVAAGLLLLSQVALGGLVSSSYAGLACPDWPACNGGQWFPTWRGTVGLHLVHRWNAVVLLVAIGTAALACRSVPRLGGIAALAAVLGLAQLFVGIANVVLGLPVEVTGLHSALAAALVLAVSAGLREAFRGEAATLGAAPAR